MKRIFLIVLFSLLVITCQAQVRLEGTYNSTSLYSQVASNTYELTLKHPLNGAVGLGNFLTDTIELATGTASNFSIKFRGQATTGIYMSYTGVINMLTGGTNTSWGPSAFTVGQNITAGTTGRFYVAQATPASTTPIFTYAGNTNTGLGRNAVGEPSMVASGVEAMRWTNTQVLVATGSGSPYYSFIGDTDTGIGQNGANQLSFICGSSLNMRLVNSALSMQCPITANNQGSTGTFFLSPALFNPTTKANPNYSFNGSLNSGLAIQEIGQPSMIASGVEIARFVATGTLGNGQVMLASGTTGNPSLSFIGDENTGIFQDAADSIRLSVGGALIAYGASSYVQFAKALIVGTSYMSVNAPSSTVPCFTFNNNTNTGLGRNDIGQPSMIASGVEAMRWTDGMNYSMKILTMSPFSSGVCSIYPVVNSSTVPGYTFLNNSNTGLGRNAVGEPSMVASGVEAMRWTQDQTLIGATGSAALPGLAFKNDPDTGLVSPGVNQLGFAAGGSQVCVVNANGFTVQNLNGFSMSGAASYAKINYAAASSTSALFSFILDTKTGLGRYSEGQPSMVASGVEAMRFTNATTTVFTYFVASAPHYEDLRFPANGLNLVGAPGAATLNTTNYFGALDFADGAISDAGTIAQMPHGWRNGSSIEPHFHIVNNSSTAGTATFELWYKIASPSGNFPTNYTVATASFLLEGSTVKHQMFDFPSIAMTGYGDSTCISFMIRRLGTHASDTLEANAILLEFDLHYINESFGSVNEHGD